MPETKLQMEHLGKYFYNLAERSQDIFWIRSADYTQVYYVSPAYQKIWGLSCESLYENSNSWLEQVLADDKDRVQAEIAQVANGGSNQDIYLLSYKLKRAEATVWIKESIFPLFNDKAQCIGYAGIAKDVSQDKKKKTDLETASRFFRFFAERTQSVFWVRDPKYNKQLYVSPAYEKIWGRSRKSLYDDPNTWIETLVPEDRDGGHTPAVRFQLLEEQGSTVYYENRYRIKKPDGTIVWIKDTSFPIQDQEDDFIGFAGIAEDVTTDVLHEQELREAKLKAELANKVKSEFLATMSHELRTPLNAILGMTQVLRLKGFPDKYDEYIDTISNASTNLLSLVNDLLDFARLEAGKLSLEKENFSMRALVTQVIQSIAYQAEAKQLTLKARFSRLMPNQVIGDARRIRQILLNLLSNAIKFTEVGGVQVQVSCFQKSAGEVMVCVLVKDTGTGISEDKLDFIFEKFSQLDSIYSRKHQGIGLGLAITKELVEKMGGLVTVKSSLGQGSEFGFTLPLELATSQKVLPQKIKTPRRKKVKGLKILVVEDNVVNQRVAKILLEDQGYQVTIAKDGAEALDLLYRACPYSLIFMDIGLPDSSGFDVVQRIREHENLKVIPIVAMTAHILQRDRDRCLAVGMNDIITKPILKEQLAEVLGRFAAG